ncbi:restriction endonuclease subunit S [Candidatus Palauibacter sp.]|uniref:restriction endonuclease subunit S n=1 Tax=Candidatus Palauibacter sp. TaxID=3101350 RepID=UPI003C6EDE5D
MSSNNLLISCSGTIGRIAVVPLHAASGVMNQALLKIDLDESIMLNSFFLGLWRSQSFEQQVLGMTHGTGMKNMKSMAELKRISFIVPPLDIQHRYAAIVESIEQQKATQRAHLAELDTLFASLQSRAFRGDL